MFVHQPKIKLLQWALSDDAINTWLYDRAALIMDNEHKPE